LECIEEFSFQEERAISQLLNNTVLGASLTLSHSVVTAIFKGWNCPHFTDGALEAQRVSSLAKGNTASK